MAVKQIIKRIRREDFYRPGFESEVIAAPIEEAMPSQKKNKSKKNDEDMTNEEIKAAEALAQNFAPEVKVVKKDRGLIERTESSKIVLTEDNRQVLSD